MADSPEEIAEKKKREVEQLGQEQIDAAFEGVGDNS
jgi:hypothetical protein